jgi:hypothetical protein
MLSGVNTLDRAIIQVNKHTRQLSTEIKNNTEVVENLEKELFEFPDIQKCEEELQDLKQRLEKVNEDILLLEKLQTLKFDLEEVVKQGKRTKEEYEKLKIVDTISLENVEKTFTLFQRVNDLSISFDNINVEEKVLQSETNRLKTLVEQEIDFEFIEINLERLEEIFDLKNQLKVFDEIKECELDIEKLNKNVKTKTEELKLFLTELQICPICEQPISKDVINKIVEE